MKLNLSKKKLILVPLVIIASVLAIGILIPTFMSDGTEKFHGEEKVAAEEGLRFIRDFHGSGIELVSAIGTYDYRIEGVKEVTVLTTGAYSNCKKLYHVDISMIGLFGYVGETTSRSVCIH